MVITRKIQTAVDVEDRGLLEEDGTAAEANSELAFVKMRFLQPKGIISHGKMAPMRSVSSWHWGANRGERGELGVWRAPSTSDPDDMLFMSDVWSLLSLSLTIFANGAKIKVIKGTTEKLTRTVRGTVRDILVAFDSCNQTYSKMKQLMHALILRNTEENLTTSRATRILDDFGEVERLSGVLKNINRAMDVETSRPDL